MANHKTTQRMMSHGIWKVWLDCWKVMDSAIINESSMISD